MAEVHIIGTIIGASDFDEPTLCCKYTILSGDSWSLIEGTSSGQTHVDTPMDPSFTLWSHPIDVHYNTKSISGWPKLIINVYHQDCYGRNILYGYGFIHIPSSPGVHELDMVTWLPTGSKNDEMWGSFMGTSVELKDLGIVHEPVDRFKLLTKSMGRVHLKLMVCIRNFKNNGIIL